ncbi:MAG: ShlB/FhaC/HecB family hemolysin secretion/activation protein [Alphaproteobacteria bacterium]
MYAYCRRLCVFLTKKINTLRLKSTVSLVMTIIFLLPEISYSGTTIQTPSQTLPKIFKKPPGMDYYEFKKKENVVPDLPEIQEKQIESTISINLSNIIILAPKNLQKVIDVSKYKEKIIGKAQNINNLYSIAAEIEKDFNQKGYPLVRVTLPVQELDQDQATVFFKVIDGFIEKIDLSKVPKVQTLRTYAYLKPLIKRKGMKLSFMERQLLLASNSAGIKLTSSLAPGYKKGGTRLIIEAEHKLLSGGLTFDNSQSKQLSRQQGQARVVINSALGFGESLSMFGLARPTKKGMAGTGSQVPIRAGGLSLSVPIGANGLTAGVSYLESMTRPGGEVESLGLEANMKTAQTTISYPLIYSRNTALFTRASLSWTDEVQQTNAGGIDEDLSHDRITAARFGTSFNSCYVGCLGVDAEISKGLEIGSRSNSQVGQGTPLSKSSATSNFTHFNINIKYTASPHDDIFFKLNGGGQYTLNDLVNSEQKGITGEEKLSGFTSGAISGDEVWYVRGQLNKQYRLSSKLIVSPYVYGAGGAAFINQPTSTERSGTSAKAMGLGVEVSGGDEYFFNKTISAKVEISKNWATSNIEDTSDVRLRKNQLLVSMAMRF